MSRAYDSFRALVREAAVLGSVQSTLGWDQETMMPPAAAPLRAEQMAALSAIVHQRWTDPRLGDLLGECEADAALRADPAAAANLREFRRDYDRQRRLPTDLVAQIAKTSSESMEAWKQARQGSDFASFAPWLRNTLDLQRRKAECIGVPAPAPGGKATLYDALLDEYEPGMRASEVEAAFRPLREALAPLIAAVARSGRSPDESINRARVPVAQQIEFNRAVAAAVGFETDGGRLDVSAHPFSDGIGPGDTRMTTRYREDHFPEACFTALHESGHSLYEQGLPKTEAFGQPIAQAASLGIHESQSRMWENFVGRSRAFWEWALPLAKSMFGAAVAGFTVDQAFSAANAVKPHFIRVESDEATYNLHIMLRFDLERALLSGDLSVADLPGAWNARMKSDLGLTVTDDRMGCLQDVHWSMGAIGYFPTYTLGNLYAAQFWETIRRDLPDMAAQHARGEFGPLLGWLRSNIHAHGRRHPAPDLCVRITGRPLSHEPLVRHLKAKVSAVYGV